MFRRTSPSNWLFLWASALVFAGSLSCSDDPSAPEEPEDRNVSVESSNRETATIGSAGGSVSTTNNAGITYTLDIPPYALPGDVEIAITPVTAIDNLPFDGRLEGAVRLGPSGLQLIKPAILTIAQAPSASGTERLIGFAYQGDADSFEPAAAIDGTTEIRVPITHFSGAGAASGEQEELEPWIRQMCASIPTRDHTFYEQVELCFDGSVTRRDWLLDLARDYLDQIVIPLIHTDLSDGVAQYIGWYSGCNLNAQTFNILDWETTLATEIENVQELLATELVATIAGEKSALCSQGGIEHLYWILHYRYLAQAAGAGDVAGLRDEDILDGLCAEVRIPAVTLADPMPLNQGTSLDARAELWISNQRIDLPVFRFTVNPTTANATCGTGQTICGGNSNELGEYTAVVTRTGPGRVGIDLFAALLIATPSGTVHALAETPLVGSETIERESYSIAATFPTTVEPGTPVTLTAVVTRNNDVGSPQPVEGAVVTFDVDGGVADPVGGQTDASGSVSTQVTANDGPNRVVVDIAAAFDGRQVATKTVEAAIETTEPTGRLVLLSRDTQILAWVPNPDECMGDPGADTRSSELGRVEVTEDANMSCSNATGTGHGQAVNQHVSDPGFAADGSSALLYFFTAGSASVQATGDYVYAASVLGEMLVSFQVLEGTVAYEINAAFNGTIGDVSVTLQGGSTSVNWTKKPGDGNPNPFATSGTLSPGGYVARFRIIAELDSQVAPASGTSGVTATIRLTAAPAAAAGNPTPLSRSPRDRVVRSR
ncbi:MAG TPA: hypothetical protein VEC56_09540 [Candidatus Krumholzibacteria bacterium]|nr:hypothetical protein [Candidatus Krumholzibacteria bacterium]